MCYCYYFAKLVFKEVNINLSLKYENKSTLLGFSRNLTKRRVKGQ